MPEYRQTAEINNLLEIVEPTDTFANAIRKSLVIHLFEMRNHQAGAILGDDIEAIHKMRVATRRIRSLMQLNESIFKPKALKLHKIALKKLADKLGAVRDIDVQLVLLQAYIETEDSTNLTAVQAAMEKRRKSAHKKLEKYLFGQSYRESLKQFTDFLRPESKGFRKTKTKTAAPYEVRHVFPPMIHEQLAKVRAYDTVLDKIEESTLHTLRIEVKRLRYLVSTFQPILGSSAAGFINQLKALQEHLGDINDASVSKMYYKALLKKGRFDPETQEAVQAYINHMMEHQEHLINTFETIWEKFNTRSVQRQLSDALLVLR